MNEEESIPPYDEAAEQGALGSILLDPPNEVTTALGILSEPQTSFFDMRHQTIFDAIVKMVDAGEYVDVITLKSRLADRGILQQVGGIPYISGLLNATPCASNANYYLHIIEEKAYARRVIQECTKLSLDVQRSMVPADELAADVETRILSLRRVKRGSTRVESFNRVMGRLEDAYDGKAVQGVLNTGFSDLDRILKGMWPGDLIILAGRPGMGKSTLAMNICEHLAIESTFPEPVTYFSFEMDDDKLNRRSLAAVSNLDLSIFDGHQASEREFVKLSAARTKLAKAPIQIEFCPGWSITQIRSRARQCAAQNKTKLFVVDMLQLVGSDRGQRANRAVEVGDVSRGLKALAGELGVPIIGVSAMNREIDKSDGRRPQLSDLRESGDIESDADVVAMLYCEDMDKESNGVLPMKLCIRKNRNGDTGEISLTFLKRLSKFESFCATQDVPSI